MQIMNEMMINIINAHDNANGGHTANNKYSN